MGNEKQKLRTGVAYAIAAFSFWGFAPIYFKQVASVPATEILAHRVIWSVLCLLAFIALTKRWTPFLALWMNRAKLCWLLMTALIVSVNWLTFIYAISTHRILETSLGYYINPLVNVLLGMLFLGERLRKIQVFAIVLASLGVLNEILVVGRLPWITLTLGLSFGFYGLLRKKIGVDPTLGLAVETSLLLPIALAYIGWLAFSGTMVFGHTGLTMDLLLFLAGPVTAIPLLWFAAAANRISLTAVGIAQYLAPSISFVLAAVLYEEPLGPSKVITFSLIWLALIVFTWEGYRFQKTPRPGDH